MNTGSRWRPSECHTRLVDQLRRLAALLAAVGAVYGAALGAGYAQSQRAVSPQTEPQPARIDRNGVVILVRNTLIALDQANKSGNYTVLRDLSAPGFQSNTAARLAEIFADERRANLDLSGVAVIEPQLTLLPQIDGSGMMRMAGFFPSVPQQVNFELLFSPENGQWRLFGLSLNVGQSSPTAPMPPQPTETPVAAARPALSRPHPGPPKAAPPAAPTEAAPEPAAKPSP